MSETVDEACAFCGGRATTRDHIPNCKFFPKPRPSDLITVPSCSPCNNATSADEEYFLNVILSHWKADTSSALATRKDRFDKRTERRVRMARRMLDDVRFDEWVTNAGVSAGQGYVLKVDAPRLERIFEKIVRGLYWEHYRERLPTDRATFSKLDDSLELIRLPLMNEILRQGVGRVVGDQTFEYRIVRMTDGSQTAQVAMVFFGAVTVLTGCLRTSDIERLRSGKPLAEDRIS